MSAAFTKIRHLHIRQIVGATRKLRQLVVQVTDSDNKKLPVSIGRKQTPEAASRQLRQLQQ